MGQSSGLHEAELDPEASGSNLGGLVMVMMVVMMVVRGCGERRSGEHHNQKNGCKNLPHALNLA